MFNAKLKEELAALRAANERQAARLKALSRSMAIIEFAPDGTVLDANDNFLKTVGYSLNEVKGQHHRIFCHPNYVKSGEYSEFWRRLNRGEFVHGQFKRRHKSGATIWLEASYNPVYDASGTLTSIMKFATDITERTNKDLEHNSIINAISRSMAMIEFNTDGTIISANDNFLHTMGYKLSEIKGKHHRIFCDPADANTPEYREFWDALNRGQHSSGQFKRISRHGSTVWLEATYNPVFDNEGNVLKVIKIAVDISEKVERQIQESEAANMAYQIAQETDKAAQAGNSVVENAINVISKIVEESHLASERIQSLNHQSEQITAIVSTIGSIADQTNLLALNAAIEAARAGEQGRGFAVVADEVRQLAARTSTSTTEITEVVGTNGELAKSAVASMEASLQQAEQGAALAREVGGKIKEIRDQAQQVVSAIGQLNSTLKNS